MLVAGPRVALVLVVERFGMDAMPDKPGCDWTAEERQRARDWVCEREQLEWLYAIARAYFPNERPEAVWNEFFARGKHEGTGKDPPRSRFDRTFDGFDPGKGSPFWSYVRMRFSFFCLERLGVIGREQDRDISLDETGDEDNEPRISAVARDDTFEEVCRRELRQAILECWLELRPELHAIFALRYFSDEMTYMSDNELSIAAVARVLRISESLAKVRLYRARLLMRECLKRKGFEP
jgi:RNA polymerase sigma factor (sigma-70 family)